MEDKKLIGALDPKIVRYDDKAWVLKKDFRDSYYNYDVNFSEYIAYFLLTRLGFDTPTFKLVSIGNRQYNLIEYLPDVVEYRNLSEPQKEITLRAFKDKLILLATINLIIGNNDIHASNILVNTNTSKVYPIDFSDTFLSKIDSNADDDSIQNQVYRRITCTLLGSMLSGAELHKSDFEKAKNDISTISVDEFYEMLETANKLFSQNLSNEKKLRILDRFIDADTYINEISNVLVASEINKQSIII